MSYLISGFFIQQVVGLGTRIGMGPQGAEPRAVVIEQDRIFRFTGEIDLTTRDGFMEDAYGKSLLDDVILTPEGSLCFTKTYERQGGNILTYNFKKRSEGFFDGTYSSGKGISGYARCLLLTIPEGYETEGFLIE